MRVALISFSFSSGMLTAEKRVYQDESSPLQKLNERIGLFPRTQDCSSYTRWRL
jgi:hypothetical protein